MMKNFENRKTEHGFTLIEMALVVVIFGFMLVGFAYAYSQYVTAQRIQNTESSIRSAKISLGDFRSLHGRYPCVASLTADRDDPDYGRETDCGDESVPIEAPNAEGDLVPAPLSAAGYLVEASMRGDLAFAPRVRVGFLPFRTLGIDEKYAYDGYGNRVMYVVTERLAVSETFDMNHGGIEVRNEAVESVFVPPASGHFLVLSYGENEAGGYSKSGVPKPCFGNSLEEANCRAQPTGIAYYRAAQYSSGGETSDIGAGVSGQFDDILDYSTLQDVPMWQISESNPTDIHQKPAGNVGFLAGSSSQPDKAAVVGGVLRVTDDPTTTEDNPHIPGPQDHLEGVIATQQICGQNGQYCFETSLIAGDLDENDPERESITGGLPCPEGSFMTAIENGHAVCATAITISCRAGIRMKGINDAGQPDCDEPPNGTCPPQSFTFCGETQSTPDDAEENETVNIVFGDNYTINLRCNANGSWSSTGPATGDCVCTPRPSESRPVVCQAGFDNVGNLQETRDYLCPQGEWTPWTNVPGGGSCECAERTETRSRNCPSGYSGGPIDERRIHSCPDSWTDWEYVSGTPCSCTEETVMIQRACEPGTTSTGNPNLTPPLPPNYWRAYDVYTCTPEGRTRTRDYSQTVWCRCQVPDPQQEVQSCPPGYTGSRLMRRTASCPHPHHPPSWGPWEEVVDDDDEYSCVSVPQTCRVRAPDNASSYSSDSPAGLIIGFTCNNCGGDINVCRLPGASAPYSLYDNCRCEP